MQKNMITTTFELPGYTIVESFGIISGVSTRFFSYNKAMQKAFDLMIKNATELGANAIVGLCFNSTIYEVFVCGTAVMVSKK